jgi:succinate dehydrogenase / fumarate reductase iron-sulfur subunit
MVEFTLPQNSSVKPGKVHAAPGAAKRPREFKIYRWDPDQPGKPAARRLQTDDLADCGADGSRRADQDQERDRPTLTFRRSCREGVCGSCAMNIDGGNTLACTRRSRT